MRMNEKAIIYKQFSIGEVGYQHHHLPEKIFKNLFLLPTSIPHAFLPGLMCIRRRRLFFLAHSLRPSCSMNAAPELKVS